MHPSVLIAAAAAVPIAFAKPIEHIQARATTTAKSTAVKVVTTSAKATPKVTTTPTTTKSSFSAAYPYTASFCVVTPVPTPDPVFHCDSKGNLTDPSVLIGDIFTGTYNGCGSICEQAQECISFGFNHLTGSCVLYSLPLTYMGLNIDNSSDVEFANRHCFNCLGGTTIAFTVVPTPAPTNPPAATVTATTVSGKKVTSSKTSASPTTTYTAGPVNIVSGGNFTNQNLGGFKASLSNAKGSFQQVGKNYAYCCTAQLLGLDSVCVLSQNINTTLGTQYDFGFQYLFHNNLPGLSSIVAPLQGGVIQEVLASAGTYQTFASRYFALTDPSLFSIVLNVPLNGNAVCITDVKVTAIH